MSISSEEKSSPSPKPSDCSGVATDFESVAHSERMSRLLETDKQVIRFSSDSFRGARVNGADVPRDVAEFERRMQHTLSVWLKSGVRGAWVQLPVSLVGSHASFLLGKGQFSMHHCREDYLMLSRWLPASEQSRLTDERITEDDSESMIPHYCHSYLSGSAIIVNERGEIAAIQEKWKVHSSERWSLPCGAIDLGEAPHSTAVREAKEETGLDCDFQGLLAVRHLHPFRFGNTGDLQFICMLTPIDPEQPLRGDPREVSKVKWMNFGEFCESNGESHRQFWVDTGLRERVETEIQRLLRDKDGRSHGMRAVCLTDCCDSYRERSTSAQLYF